MQRFMGESNRRRVERIISQMAKETAASLGIHRDAEIHVNLEEDEDFFAPMTDAEILQWLAEYLRPHLIRELAPLRPS